MAVTELKAGWLYRRTMYGSKRDYPALCLVGQDGELYLRWLVSTTETVLPYTQLNDLSVLTPVCNMSDFFMALEEKLVDKWDDEGK